MSLFIITWVFDAGIIPQYIIYNQFGFVNSPWVMIVPGAINTQFLIITKTFLEGIPNELEEAAVVDGASDIKILTRVFLPLSPTVLATTGLFYAVSIPSPADLFEGRRHQDDPAGVEERCHYRWRLRNNFQKCGAGRRYAESAKSESSRDFHRNAAHHLCVSVRSEVF